MPVDDDNISDFLKGLECYKNRPSFQKTQISAGGKRGANNKLQSLRANHNG